MSTQEILLADVLPLVVGSSPAPPQPAMAMAEASRGLFGGRTVLDTLQRIVDLSVKTVRGCDGASVSFVQGEAVVTPVWTQDTVIEVDALQYSYGEGPCLDAIAHEATFYASDLSRDPRWPVFGPQAARRGMHSLLSLRLGTDRTLGSLNLYARSRAAYDEPDRWGALAYSIHAGMALSASDTLETATLAWADDSKRLGRLERGLSSRQTIAFAQGMLMARDRIDAHEAFTLLRRASLHRNIKLSGIAQHVIDTGEIQSGPVEPLR